MSEDLLHKGLDLIESGKYDEAVESLKYCIKIYPSNPDAFCALGVCYIKMGKQSKGEQYIAKARNMGSSAAYELELERTKKDGCGGRYIGIKGFLLLFCISIALGSLLNIYYFILTQRFSFFVLGSWGLISFLLLVVKYGNPILNAKAFVVATILFNCYDLTMGDSEAVKRIAISIAWLVYLFVSKRVKSTYSGGYYPSEGTEYYKDATTELKKNPGWVKPKSQIIKTTPSTQQQLAMLKYKVVAFAEGANLKLLVIFASIVVLVASVYLLKTSFDIKNTEEDRYSFVPAGENKAFKIDKKTGEKWLITPHGERKIENRMN